MTKAGVGIASSCSSIISIVARRASHGDQLEALPVRVRGRLDVHLSASRRHAVARACSTTWCAAAGSPSVRRIAEAMTDAFPLIFLAGLGFIIPVARRLQGPLLLGAPRRAQPGAQPDAARTSSAGCRPASSRSATCIYGLIFIGMAGVLREEVARAGRARRSEDVGHACASRRAGDDPVRVRDLLPRVGRPDVVAPKWYSTIYGVELLGLRCVGGFAALALFVLGIQRTGRLDALDQRGALPRHRKVDVRLHVLLGVHRVLASSCCSGTATCRRRRTGTSTGCSASGSGCPSRCSSASGHSRSCS